MALEPGSSVGFVQIIRPTEVEACCLLDDEEETLSGGSDAGAWTDRGVDVAVRDTMYIGRMAAGTCGNKCDQSLCHVHDSKNVHLQDPVAIIILYR